MRYKPKVIIPLVKGVISKKVLKRMVLRTVDLAVTGDCHYRCEFCSAYTLYRKGGPYLSVPQIHRIWEECRALGAMHVNLTGGEPLMRGVEELCVIIGQLFPSKYLVSLVTSGFSLTSEKIRKLKESGLDTLQLSIESLDPDVHDHLVGFKGSHGTIIESLRYAKEAKLNVCLNAVFYHDNSREIHRLIDFCKKQKVFLVLNTASSEGKWAAQGHNRLQKKDIVLFERFLRAPYVRHDSSMNYSLKRECPGGKERIHITAYGDVLTCPLVQISYGNVLNEPLAGIYQRMNAVPLLKRSCSLCKHAFDEEYYQTMIQPCQDFQGRPVSCTEHPCIRSV